MLHFYSTYKFYMNSHIVQNDSSKRVFFYKIFTVGTSNNIFKMLVKSHTYTCATNPLTVRSILANTQGYWFFQGLHHKFMCEKLLECITYLDLITQDMMFLMYMLSCVHVTLLLDDDNDVLHTEFILMNLNQQLLHFMFMLTYWNHIGSVSLHQGPIDSCPWIQVLIQFHFMLLQLLADKGSRHNAFVQYRRVNFHCLNSRRILGLCTNKLCQ